MADAKKILDRAAGRRPLKLEDSAKVHALVGIGWALIELGNKMDQFINIAAGLAKTVEEFKETYQAVTSEIECWPEENDARDD